MSRASGLVALGVFAACAAGNPRPPYPPVAGALEENLPNAIPLRVVEAALDAFYRLGFPVRLFSKEDGYVETAYADVVTGGPAEDAWSLRERSVKFRLRVDPADKGSRLTLEVLYRPRSLPGAGDRLNEEMVPRAHPGYEEGRRVLALLREELSAPDPGD